MRNFLGHDGFIWWIGIVEDINDPLTLGRCKVRCFGYHPAKATNLVPTGDLPWATTIHPLNTPNLYGTPRIGEWVFGFFLDSLSAQEPAILGYLPAIPEAASTYFGTPSSLTRNFANVTNKNDVLWDVNDASIKISAGTNLTLDGKTNLIFSDSANTTTLNALLSRISTIENQLNIVTTVNQLNTVVLVPSNQYSDFWSKALTLTPGYGYISGAGGVMDRNWGLYRSWYGSNPDTTWGSTGTTTTKSGEVSLRASGNGVDVVIVDGVIDPNHPEFAVNSDGTGGSRVKYFNWYSLNIPGDSSYGQTYSPPITTNRSSSSDDSRHAVHVAGTVAGNSQGWAPNANIYNISPQYVTGGVQYVNLYKYILYWHNQKRAAGDMTPTIVNNSWNSRYTINYTDITSVTYQGSTVAGPFTIQQLAAYGITVDSSDNCARIALRNDAMDADIEACINAGVIMVAAAGNFYYRMTTDSGDVDYNNTVTATGANSGNPIYYSRGTSPGSASGVICVGGISSSTDSPGADRKLNYSNRGPRVDVFAPGAIITSAWLTTTGVSSPAPTPVPDARDSRYYVAKLSGTSMASPQVCGVLACALEITPTMNQAAAMAYITQNAGINQIPTTTGGIIDPYDLLGAPNRYLAVPSNLRGTI
jgi:hypothetical protein